MLVLFGAALFGTTGTAVARVPGGADPWTTGSLRLLVGGGLLVLVAIRRLSSIRDLTMVLAIGAVMVAGYQLAFFWAVTDTGVAVSTLTTIGVSPLASRVVGAMRHRPPPPRHWFLSAGLLLVGLFALLIGGYEEVEVEGLGIVAAVVAGTAFAGYTECASVAVGRGAHPDAVLGVLFLGAGVLTAPVLVLRPIDVFETSRGFVVLLHLGVITLTLAYMAFGRGLRHLPPTSVTMLTIAEPLVATGLAVVFLDERFSFIGGLGAMMILIGLISVALPSAPSRATVRS